MMMTMMMGGDDDCDGDDCDGDRLMYKASD